MYCDDKDYSCKLFFLNDHGSKAQFSYSALKQSYEAVNLQFKRIEEQQINKQQVANELKDKTMTAGEFKSLAEELNKPIFIDIHFLVIAMKQLERHFKDIVSYTIFNEMKYHYEIYKEAFSAYFEVRNHLEHYDDRINKRRTKLGEIKEVQYPEHANPVGIHKGLKDGKFFRISDCQIDISNETRTKLNKIVEAFLEEFHMNVDILWRTQSGTA